MADDLSEQIAERAKGPQSVSIDGQSVTQVPLKDQIEVDRCLASKQAMRKRRRGHCMSRVIPPGAV